jgi:hypothetical protein
MAVKTVVPLNTMLADLDETLRQLLKRELADHGFDGVQIAFEAPTREWAATLTAPTVDLFLYDLREALKRRPVEWTTRRENGRAHDVRPPLRLEVSYAVTAWTRTVEDEHRLLSQVLAVLFAYYKLPEPALHGTLANGSQRFPLETTIGHPRSEGKADFWSAVGGQYKASLDYVVLASCEAGTLVERGPDVESRSVRVGRMDDVRSAIEERHTLVGRVCDEAGDPVAGTWVVLPDAAAWAVTDDDGRFRFDGVVPGRHRCVARGPAGGGGESEADVPGTLELVLDGTVQA